MLKLFCFCTLWISDDAKGKRYIMPISVIFFKVLIFFGLGLKAKTKKMKIWLITVKTVICLGSHTYIFDLINIYLWIWLEVWKILVNNCVLNLKTVLAEISLLSRRCLFVYLSRSLGPGLVPNILNLKNLLGSGHVLVSV